MDRAFLKTVRAIGRAGAPNICHQHLAPLRARLPNPKKMTEQSLTSKRKINTHKKLQQN